MRALLILSAVFAIALQADNTRIAEATIFYNNAYVSRKGDTSLKKGSGRLTIGPLPVEVQDSTVTFRFNQSTNARIHSVLIREKIEKKFQSNKIKILKKKYHLLLNNMNRIRNELDIIDRHIDSIDKIQPRIREKPEGITEKSDPATRNKYLLMIETMQKKNLEKKISTLKELDDTREEFIIIGAILDNYKKAETASFKQVEIEYDTDRDEEATFTMNYLLTGAYWYPRYEVSVDTAGKSNFLKFYSIIKNNTGEDWKNIKLKLSTANPDFSFQPPELNEWHIGMKESYPEESKVSSAPRKKSYSRKNTGQKADDRYMDKEMEEAAPMISSKTRQENSPELVQQATGDLLKKSYKSSRSVKTEEEVNELKANIQQQSGAFTRNEYDNAINYGLKAKSSILVLSQKYGELLKDNRSQIEELLQRSYFLKANYKIGKDLVPPGGYDTIYSVKLKQTILSDNSLNKIHVSGEALPSEYFYETSPLSHKSVFLKSVSRPGSKQPYLAGPMDIFANNTYLGTSRIETTGPGFPVKMELGNDRDITVDRRENIYSEKSGIISSSLSKSHKVTVTITNSRPVAADITLIDRIPVSKDEKIRVELAESSDTPEIDEKTGILKFKIRLASGAKKIIHFTYLVKRPATIKIRETETGGTF